MFGKSCRANLLLPSGFDLILCIDETVIPLSFDWVMVPSEWTAKRLAAHMIWGQFR